MNPIAPKRPGTALAPVSDTPTVQSAFVLLFAVTPDAAAQQAALPQGLVAIPDQITQSYRSRLDAMQQRLLGEPYLQARRLTRTAVGRLPLPEQDGAPDHADIHLVKHKSGAAVWEVWLLAPPQALDAVRWVAWLDMDDPGSLARHIWRTLRPAAAGQGSEPEMMLPLMVLRCASCTLDELLDSSGHELVKLLHRDMSDERFKPSFVQQELDADFCRRAQGLSLVARNGAMDVHAQPNDADDAPLPRNTLPLLVTLELLCLERAVLRSFLNRFAQGVYGTTEDLVQLRRDIFDGLEEYYGTLAKTHGYTAEATALGEVLFGINDLFDSVVDRLGALTFEITTRNQKMVNQLGFWLTTSFGAIETGFVASSIATWYYTDNLSAVLGWTIGVTLATTLVIAGLLRWRLKR
ncbi:MAG: hypothetical protein KJ614_15015 [Gammaproteobacteria bacterium]|uniref:hypothetical protein n=1 Tax=Rhodoferax sp. TaxID=50421 RepID=UPI0017C7A408|nr:hypothetical protein [Rhodoferax sp.]MBU3900208.1 hypothetical protein [Gammaproteobacteria bacterium]MBA3058788.1 hypothetical protein [Rhodoferax sp.]MBU3999532.1 hypothetical protein [Gammaproteobacteria bacterium]MBU4082272.1 hypothetical protein [Gammaproteobacteria bacterium]MBU4113100.1 hypothetical protein [Gammaproteobacteria bacterium]